MLLVTDSSPWGVRVSRELSGRGGFTVTHVVWSHGDPPLPNGLGGWQGDWIVGFKADLIISPAELAGARAGAVNFHPAPPDLRGVGTYQVALREGRSQYGVTCHHMTRTVDAGPIIAVHRFGLADGWDATLLEEAAAAHLYALLLAGLPWLAGRVSVPTSAEVWSGRLHTWKQLESADGDGR